MVSSGMLHRVVLVRTDISEEPSASFMRVTRIGELGTTLGVTSNRRTLRRNTEWYFFIYVIASLNKNPLLRNDHYIRYDTVAAGNHLLSNTATIATKLILSQRETKKEWICFLISRNGGDITKAGQ
jgi:hypothetical protein